jgi:hypothetical protein
MAVAMLVGQVTLDAALVAETVAQMLEADERMVAFNRRQETPTSNALFIAASDLFNAAVDAAGDVGVDLWEKIADLAKARARGGDDA